MKKNINVSSQKIYKLQNFADYMTLNPRQYLGANNVQIMKLIPSQHDKEEKPNYPTDTKTKPNKLYQDIQDLIKIMHQFKTSEKDNLYKLTRETRSADRYIELYQSNQWNRIYPSAKEEFTPQNQLQNINYYTWFMNFDPKEYPRNKYMTWQETKRYLYYWAMEQHLNPNTLLRSIYNMLKMNDNKITPCICTEHQTPEKLSSPN